VDLPTKLNNSARCWAIICQNGTSGGTAFDDDSQKIENAAEGREKCVERERNGVFFITPLKYLIHYALLANSQLGLLIVRGRLYANMPINFENTYFI
jgi:hypothetical protein